MIVDLIVFLIACVISACFYIFNKNKVINRSVFIAIMPVTFARLILNLLFP